MATRFEDHLSELRSSKIARGQAGVDLINDHPEHDDQSKGSFEPPISDADFARILRRAQRIIDLRKAASRLDHLPTQDRERLEAFRNGTRLVMIATEARADELAAELHKGMPWMAPATEIVWHAMRQSVREGWQGMRLPPLLLDGPPGIGKSYWARRLGDLLTVPVTVIEATGENATFGVVGTQRGWGNASAGRLLNTVLETRIANPIMIVDEVEKAGEATSNKGATFGLAQGLLPLLEPLTARRWSCPFYQVRFDMSWVSWVLTSNNYKLLPEPLLSRCPPMRLRNLTPAELDEFVRRDGGKRSLSDASIDAVAMALRHAQTQGVRPDLRLVSRLLQRAVFLENAPPLQ
ncbi:AAA family ATPase [Frigidibacter albus]|nr:AAA family ATPase [Frigidibacter albus]